jgi:hypothetical protein
MSNKNNSAEQKKAWKENRKLGSKFITVTPADKYNPEPKPPSKRDNHRQEVMERKQK